MIQHARQFVNTFLSDNISCGRMLKNKHIWGRGFDSKDCVFVENAQLNALNFINFIKNSNKWLTLVAKCGLIVL